MNIVNPSNELSQFLELALEAEYTSLIPKYGKFEHLLKLELLAT